MSVKVLQRSCEVADEIFLEKSQARRERERMGHQVYFVRSLLLLSSLLSFHFNP